MQILHLASLAQSQILKSQKKKKEDEFSILKKSVLQLPWLIDLTLDTWIVCSLMVVFF